LEKFKCWRGFAEGAVSEKKAIGLPIVVARSSEAVRARGGFIRCGPAVIRFLASVGFMPNGVELKAERRKPSVEKPCDIEDNPSFTGVLAHFRLH